MQPSILHTLGLSISLLHQTRKDGYIHLIFLQHFIHIWIKVLFHLVDQYQILFHGALIISATFIQNSNIFIILFFGDPFEIEPKTYNRQALKLISQKKEDDI